MEQTLLGLLVLGVVCVIAAIAGGVKLLGNEIPRVKSKGRQVLLAVVGFTLVIGSLVGGRIITVNVPTKGGSTQVDSPKISNAPKTFPEATPVPAGTHVNSEKANIVTKENSNKSSGSLLIQADAASTIYVDGKPLAALGAGKVATVAVPLGVHVVQAESSNPTTDWEQQVDVSEPKQIMVKTELMPKIKAKGVEWLFQGQTRMSYTWSRRCHYSDKEPPEELTVKLERGTATDPLPSITIDRSPCEPFGDENAKFQIETLEGHLEPNSGAAISRDLQLFPGSDHGDIDESRGVKILSSSTGVVLRFQRRGTDLISSQDLRPE